MYHELHAASETPQHREPSPWSPNNLRSPLTTSTSQDGNGRTYAIATTAYAARAPQKALTRHSYGPRICHGPLALSH